MLILFHRWRAVSEEDEAAFKYLEQEIWTNSSTTSHTIEHLQPYTVYSFQVIILTGIQLIVANTNFKMVFRYQLLTMLDGQNPAKTPTRR